MTVGAFVFAPVVELDAVPREPPHAMAKIDMVPTSRIRSARERDGLVVIIEFSASDQIEEQTGGLPVDETETGGGHQLVGDPIRFH